MKQNILLPAYSGRLLLILLFVLHVLACNSIQAADLGTADSLRVEIERLRAAKVAPRILDENVFFPAAIQALYISRGFNPIWTDSGLRKINRLLVAIKDSERHGLDPVDYHLEVIQALSAGEGLSLADQVRLDLLASDAWLMLASHYATGKIKPKTVDKEWHAAARDFDALRVMEKAIADGQVIEILADLTPRQAGYKRLLALLTSMRSMADWPQVKTGKTLKKGMRTVEIISLRQRLQAVASLSSTAGMDDVFDQETEEAVKEFQTSHGLKADGIVGPATMAALNVTRQERIRQIIVNLERWRWLPEVLGNRHIRVNIAGFLVEAWEQGQVALSMKAIVGRGYRKTPVFSGNMSYIVFNPYWEVPPNIAIKDKLSMFSKDDTAFERGGYELLPLSPETKSVRGDERIEWKSVDPKSFRYRLRQRPGPLNALGRVKLMFPNPYNVYLHDTPDRNLFEQEVRTFSSGCIRLQKPIELAAWVLAGKTDWNRDKIDQIIDSGVTKTVMVAPVIPVYLQYWTVWVGEDGVAKFFNDIYKRDEVLDKKMRE